MMAAAMEEIYYNAKHPAAFGGVQRLGKAIGRGGAKKAKEWLQGQRVYTLHKNARKRYNTRRYKVKGKHALWQADLVEMIP